VVAAEVRVMVAWRADPSTSGVVASMVSMALGCGAETGGQTPCAAACAAPETPDIVSNDTCTTIASGVNADPTVQ
jgi:hypothetical protein